VGGGLKAEAVNGEECDSCDLTLVRIASVGRFEDAVTVREDASLQDCMVTRDPHGRIFVSGLIGGGVVARFAPDGSFDMEFGRRGEGPGELGAELRVSSGPGDSITVVDSDQQRLSVFSPDGQFERAFQVPRVTRPWATMADGSLVIGGSGQDGPWLQMVSPDGMTRSSLGAPLTGPADPTDAWLVSPSSSGGMWVASIWEYKLVLLDSLGTPTSTVERSAEWFPNGQRYESGMPFTVRPPPVLRHIHDQGDGYVLVASAVPDPAWEAELPLTPGYEWGRRAFDTRLELIDIASGRVSRATVVDAWLGFVCNSSLVYQVSEGDDMVPRLDLFELR